MRVTASGLARLAKCRAVAVLPWAGTETKHANFGTVVHAFLKDVPVLGKDAALMRVPFEHQAACDAIDLEQLPASQPESYAYEAAFIYDAQADSAIEVSRGADRIDGSSGEWLVTGTTDVVGTTESAVVILDYKTGWSDYGPVEENWQLKFYALAAARTYKKSEAFTGIIRLKENGDAYYQRGRLSALELDEAAAALYLILERAEADRLSGEIPTPRQGEHCKYCPAFDSCPAKQGLARQPVAAQFAEKEAVEQLSDEQMVALYEEMQARDAVHKRIWEVLDERAATKPIRFSNGFVYGSKEHTERRIIPELAEPLLAEAFGIDVPLTAIEVDRTLTQKGLERGLRPYVSRTKGAKIGKVKEAAMAMLEERGAVRQARSLRVKYFKPKPGEELLPPPEAQAPALEASNPEAPAEPTDES